MLLDVRSEDRTPRTRASRNVALMTTARGALDDVSATSSVDPAASSRVRYILSLSRVLLYNTSGQTTPLYDEFNLNYLFVEHEDVSFYARSLSHDV